MQIPTRLSTSKNGTQPGTKRWQDHQPSIWFYPMRQIQFVAVRFLETDRNRIFQRESPTDSLFFCVLIVGRLFRWWSVMFFAQGATGCSSNRDSLLRARGEEIRNCQNLHRRTETPQSRPPLDATVAQQGQYDEAISQLPGISLRATQK